MTSKELYELRQQFEMDMKKMPVSAKFEREPATIAKMQRFYTDGMVNAMFIAYMAGYQSAKCLARMNALPLAG